MRDGLGGDYVDQSAHFLLAISDAYFESPNAMRELLRAVVNRKPIMTLTHTGGSRTDRVTLSHEHIRHKLCEAEAKYERWGLADEVCASSIRIDTATPHRCFCAVH